MSNTKLGLVRSDFNIHTSKTFGALFRDNNFSDVTLVCEDHKQISAHKAILSSSSNFFKAIFLKSPHPNPLVYLKLKSSDVESLVRFMYLGECQVKQEDIDMFLNTARDLKVEGLASCGEERAGKEEGLKKEDMEENTHKPVDSVSNVDDQTNQMLQNIYLEANVNDDDDNSEMVDDPIFNADIKSQHREDSSLYSTGEENTIIADMKEQAFETDVLQDNFDLKSGTMPTTGLIGTEKANTDTVNKYNRVMSYAAKLKNVAFQPLHLTPREELPQLLCSFFKLARTKKMEIFNASSYTTHLYSFKRYLSEISDIDIMKARHPFIPPKVNIFWIFGHDLHSWATP